MKLLERFSYTIFSIIVLIIALVLLGIMFNILEMSIIIKSISFILEDINAYKISLVISIICIILAIKGIFFKSKRQDLAKDGIVLENSSGKLVISKESLENLVASVSKEIPGADVISSRTILDKEKNLKVYVVTTVSKDMMLKDVSTELQNKIKDAMKKTADLEVKEVNIKIKNITSKKVKKIKNNEQEENEIIIEENEETLNQENEFEENKEE
ncbi:MAG: alkaline shock response membrane anchor protein AmaP [Clostridia bacterium]|nr:alkaline shock response membrane anchor protein AmaP [Clostridia bacterium]